MSMAAFRSVQLQDCTSVPVFVETVMSKDSPSELRFPFAVMDVASGCFSSRTRIDISCPGFALSIVAQFNVFLKSITYAGQLSGGMVLSVLRVCRSI